ncbi:LacI family DNA-binding transcriptional regulator [Xanthomonas rydalmerensis]|uniref:LacI family DNA-binding transcriptional regulator n=1 Tax=Xanthomonas rydalmerensis TaxID=3046274 RepID=A0ABZ0JKA0_9XANT|nr:LacI family DNA-binding transcriptional regulator [Xanthomonas sp. DM-2023]WOS39438.1 LacI family DNA-binding transcriptional regulator [Xanthomonas sp. DM-2023]WOS43622.1 LacI family DNA-binding transcriptional regulator [Xanthomonas sp. DM-2023]WOS47803.1 LacI family DNA-binding transcriptional regulator [Xanthomonas sp. DM-2023]WOS51981.1 LacI family DNA-binding transcriptional regulator [Xanthomonas sp. DM-2023]WOS56165.1 LacI family DNA-binding transcriptional regulator [Xanthomonas sp
MATTIYDIAKHVGVTAGTVSRALSRPEKVLPATRARIEQAAAALGYVPNTVARTLKTQRSGKLLVTVPDIANPFFAQILQGAEDAAQAVGYAVLLGDTQHQPDREERYAQMLPRNEADGLIVLGHRLPPTAREIVKQQGGAAPVVNGCEFDPALGIPSVHIDNAAAARAVMEHLYGLGHARIAVVGGPPDNPLHQQRLEGVQASGKAHRRLRSLTVVPGDFSVESGHAAAMVLLGRTPAPTAIFCFSDQMALGALAACRDLGIRVPDDLSIVGFDDLASSSYLTPPLTTIRQPMREIGVRAVNLLLAIIEKVDVPLQQTLDFSLMVRGSTGAPRG